MNYNEIRFMKFNFITDNELVVFANRSESGTLNQRASGLIAFSNQFWTTKKNVILSCTV